MIECPKVTTDFLKECHPGYQEPFSISIRRVSKCLFSRRLGFQGNRIFGLSVCIRLFGFNITKT